MPQLVLRTGQTVTSNRFSRTAVNFFVSTGSGGNDGKPRAHNDAGQVAVGIFYASNSGVWLA